MGPLKESFCDWIDNDGRGSVDRIDPAPQRLAVGDRIEVLPTASRRSGTSI
jgi:hypothetical protein